MSIFSYIFGTLAPEQVQKPNYDSPISSTNRYSIDNYNHNKIILNNFPMDTSPCNSSPETTSPDQNSSIKYPKHGNRKSLTGDCGVSTSDTESLRSSVSSMDDIVCQKYKKPRVTINNCVNVILIPTRSEYCCVGLSADIWWSRDELYNVKLNCQEEILTHVANNSSMTIKDVMRHLYQP